jgi:hypothetical protein
LPQRVPYRGLGVRIEETGHRLDHFDEELTARMMIELPTF